MNLLQLQTRLRASGRYAGKLDGQYGPMTKAAILLAMTDGPDTKLTAEDFRESAARLDLQPAHIIAFTKVESGGEGFRNGRSIILFEGHRFSRATRGAFDQTHPRVSYPHWDRAKYPAGQDARYDQLCEAVSLNVDAGFASASYGLFQVLGENYELCGFASPFDFAEAMARDEESQLKAVEGFLTRRGVVRYLKAGDWESVARIYNGSAFRENQYDIKLAKAFKAAGGV